MLFRSPGFHDDHWITEYWDGASWRLMDSELTPGVRRHFGVTFDPCDVPRDRFVTAGRAWRDARSGRIDSAKCGVWSVGIASVWFVAGSVVRDLAALNKREMLPWDYWGMSRDMRPGIPVSEAAAARIDTLAALIADPEPDWRTLREEYESDEALGVPRVVMSFPRGRPTEVAVGARRVLPGGASCRRMGGDGSRAARSSRHRTRRWSGPLARIRSPRPVNVSVRRTGGRLSA